MGALKNLEQLPASRLRADLGRQPGARQERALKWLQSFHFTESDLPSLHADPEGGIFYVCEAVSTTEADETEEVPTVSQAAVPVSPVPSSLVFHSRPGAPNVLYLNFSGENVVNTEWNTVVGRSEIPAVAFSTDSDLTTFSDAEQVAIKRIWQRMAEDYAPFNIDVTTERPGTFTTRTAVAIITRTTDANGAANPYSSAGGVAYVNVFGTTSYAKYRPAWIYHGNLGNSESLIAEAASHEIGHNMGLSHDGKTDGTEYYGGHGSGDTSWGPLMGTGYHRNVSHWCKGDYYLANNTQDDLATIAGKISYRADDHGNTSGTATALSLTGGTNIVSTNPENDPANTNPANKGVLERNTDLDVFSFVTGNGQVSVSVKPWIMPSGTRGGNIDILLQLYNEAGTLLLTNNPGTTTTALIQTNLSEGRYYVHVRNSGAGDPLSSTPSGYTAYASLGQYFISGYITAPTTFVAPPVAELQITDVSNSGEGTKQFTVSYSDDVAVDVSTIDTGDVRIVGPNGYDRLAQFVSVDFNSDGTPRVATYAVEPPSGASWLPADNGTYTVWMEASQVGDVEGAWVAAGQLGEFKVAVPVAIYLAKMDTDPGWTLEPQWEYGVPSYSSGGPSGGYTGTKIIAYNLSGEYTSRLSVKYATTPAINCSGASSATLRFNRWLRTKAADTASIQASADGITWVDVWSTSSAVSDTSWQAVQYTLPAGIAGSPTVRIRWGLSSNPAQNDIGWNIDDVEVLGDGALDTTPPVPSLSVANLTIADSPSHACSVTYTDDTAVRLSSLGPSDLVVIGPNGYSNLVEFAGADLPSDGTPITGSYSIPAPGGAWDATDNGTYNLTLFDNEIEDVNNNVTPQTALGSFDVSISTSSPGMLAVSPAGGLSSSGTVGGSFSPSSIVYTLTNSGGSSFNWTVSKGQSWVSLSATAGSLAAGATTNVTVSINSGADSLAAGNYSDTVQFANTTTGSGNTSCSVSLAVQSKPAVELIVTVNNASWGSVSPANGSYFLGSSVELFAIPSLYHKFVEWNGDVSGPINPLNLILETNTSLGAMFGEIMTTNHPTPHSWLASNGYTSDFENAVTQTGANGLPVWQSYIAGLDPNDPESQFLLTGEPASDLSGYVLSWNTASNRVYTIWSSSNLADFSPLPGAEGLPWTTRSFTNSEGSAPQKFFRLQVDLEANYP